MKLNEEFNKVQEKGLQFIQNYSSKLIGLLMFGTVVSLGMHFFSSDSKDRPTQTRDFAKTSVMIVDAEMRSGGTGVVLRSTDTYSEILTNKHVCRLVEAGGLVIQNGNRYLVDSIKKYSKHDLCLVKIYQSLGINTEVSKTPPRDFEDAFISGHPALLPHVLTKGNFSGRQIIQLLVGIKKCTVQEENGPYGMYCTLMGGIPIVQSFASQLVTGTILPGSSGSGVFNSKGEISGLVFAGRGDGLGYAFIVPHEFVVDFIQNEANTEYKPVNQNQYDSLIRRIFEKQKSCALGSSEQKVLKNYCQTVQNYLIWELTHVN